jgi:chemotaxis protein methyltransferase CheR
MSAVETADTADLNEIELDLLVEAIYRRYGYDFRNYARASLMRRVKHHLTRWRVPDIASLIPVILRDEMRFQSLLFDISVTVTEMFRDPWFFVALQEQVFPFLQTFPFLNIWVAGCATGEEVYSLAILLQESGLAERARIYATDINTTALKKARSRIYPLDRMKDASRNYLEAGGKRSLSAYYIAEYDGAILAPSLQKRVTFASHNLATDGVFGEMHLILCRNVLIYFDRSLQNRVLRTFRDSLRRNGFLCLGNRETLDFSDVRLDFDCVDSRARIYQFKGSKP